MDSQGYYIPNASRENFTVLVSAHVAEIITTQGADGLLTATGVKFIRDGVTHSVQVNKEVVLSAGYVGVLLALFISPEGLTVDRSIHLKY